MRNLINRASLLTLALMLWLGAMARLAAHGDLHERIDAVTAQILTNQSSPELWLQRADLRRQHEEFDAALTDLEKAGQLKPNWATVALQRARILFDLGDYARAEDAASDCLKLDYTNADALVLRARSRVQLNEPKAAVADYDAVLNRTNTAPPLPDLYLERARAQAAIGKLDEALHGLDDGMKRLGESPSLALPAIEFERQRGTYDAALDRLERARGYYNPESFLATRGEILLQANRRADAKVAFEEGLAKMEALPTERRAMPLIAAIEARLRSGLKQATVSPLP